MKLARLAAAGRQPGEPLLVELAGQQLHVLHWLRVLPGRRYVAKARWQGRVVLAKIFVGAKAERDQRLERAGVRQLFEQRLNTPELLSEQQQRGEGGWLLFEFLEQAQGLGQHWQAIAQQPALSEPQQRLLSQALEALAQLHRHGLWQADLHLDNLLLEHGQLYLVDGADIRAEKAGQALSQAKVLDNLGLFFAQLPETFDAHLETLLKAYQANDGQPTLSLVKLRRLIRKARARRLRDILDKAGRDCSLFAARRDSRHLQAVRRDWLERLAPVLADPDTFLAQGRRLKSGNSATVASIRVDGRDLILKRYNLKGPWHWLRRCARPSRAWHSWIEAIRLEFLGIPTARPLAVLEERRWGLRRRSFLLTEYLAGEDALTHFAPWLHGAPPEAELNALLALFDALKLGRIRHGDLKGSNIFWQQDHWALIDLDAARQFRSQSAFATAHRDDIERFLRNWPTDSPLRKVFRERLLTP